MKTMLTLLLSVCTFVLSAGETIRPVHTYSIVARDSVTGELGVAVQSHWFQVGNSVTWAEAGVGVVATQSFIEISYGPLGLELMRAGKTAPQALKALLEIDPQRDVRQVAMVDARGNVAVHTGKNCIAEAGHIKGEQFSVQANIMEKNTVWGAMAKAYREAKGDLLNRLMAALDAAQVEGGDIRGKQSAAILIVPGTTQGQPWREKIVDLRVDDSPHPLRELHRLVTIHRAYEHMNRGDEYLSENKIDKALEEYSAAYKIYPENVEILYWTAATMAGAGRVRQALPLFREVFKKEPQWKEVTRRLPKSGLLPDDPDLMRVILGTEK
ncbi:MAG: DUF1028 domain-containing protein [Calditrichaeota bacterium]|nr:MAG: DUF1028 domain-containing protein [Calditrichota bacterium]